MAASSWVLICMSKIVIYDRHWIIRILQKGQCLVLCFCYRSVRHRVRIFPKISFFSKSCRCMIRITVSPIWNSESSCW